MSCQFHPTISDSKPASPTAVLLHLYYLHDPRLGLPRPHHAFPGDIGPPPWLDDDCDSDMDESYDDDELWCCGPGLYVAYECVRLWVEPDTAVRELCEHLEDVVSWPIDDMGVQVWHADSKLHPTHTFAQLGWFRQLAPATSASPPSSPYDRLVLCLPADPCVCTHCCRIDFARAKRRVKLVRRHIEQHYQEVVLAEEEEEEEEARRRDGRSNGAGGKGKRGGVGGGGSIEEDDSWMDEVDDSGKGSMEKSASKGQKGKAAGAKKVKSKLSKEAQRLLKKEKEAKEEKERKAREQKEKEEQARQERAKRDAEALAEQERAEREKEAARRQLREQQQRQREEAEKDVRWQKEWAEWAEEETKVGPPGGPPTVATVAATKVVTTAAASTVKTKQASSKAAIDKQESSSNKSKSTAASGKPQTSPKQQSQKKAQRHAKATADSTNPPSPVTNHTAVQQHTTAVHSEPHQSNTPTSTTQHATATHIYTHQPQQQHQSKRQWKKTAVDNCTQTHDSTPPLSHPSTSSALPDHPTATVKPAAVPAVAAVVAPTKWKGWGSPRTASLCPPSSVQPLPLSPHSICSTSTTTSTMSPYPSHYSAAACTDDDSSWLGSDSFSLFLLRLRAAASVLTQQSSLSSANVRVVHQLRSHIAVPVFAICALAVAIITATVLRQERRHAATISTVAIHCRTTATWLREQSCIRSVATVSSTAASAR